jgi:hypothetical protein
MLPDGSQEAETESALAQQQQVAAQIVSLQEHHDSIVQQVLSILEPQKIGAYVYA